MLARLGRLAVEEQVGEQRLGPRRLERRQRRLAEAQVELAEEPDHERRRIPRIAASRPSEDDVTESTFSGGSVTSALSSFGRRPWASCQAQPSSGCSDAAALEYRKGGLSTHGMRTSATAQCESPPGEEVVALATASAAEMFCFAGTFCRWKLNWQARHWSRGAARARECPLVRKCTRLVPARRLRWRLGRQQKAPFAGLFLKPSDGLEPSTPSLPWRCSTN